MHASPSGFVHSPQQPSIRSCGIFYQAETHINWGSTCYTLHRSDQVSAIHGDISDSYEPDNHNCVMSRTFSEKSLLPLSFSCIITILFVQDFICSYPSETLRLLSILGVTSLISMHSSSCLRDSRFWWSNLTVRMLVRLFRVRCFTNSCCPTGCKIIATCVDQQIKLHACVCWTSFVDSGMHHYVFSITNVGSRIADTIPLKLMSDCLR